jgi:hypothetical protein
VDAARLPRQALSNDGEHLEIHEIAPSGHPLIEGTTVLARHELYMIIETFKNGDPAPVYLSE